MRRAGFVRIGFGLESAVPRVLRMIGKVRAPDTGDQRDLRKEREYLKRFRIAVKGAQLCGLKVTVSVIGGLPGDTAVDFRRTLEFVASLNVERYAHNMLSLLPGTPLHQRQPADGFQAFREPATGIWRTVHSYDVRTVAPLPHSTVHLLKWGDANRLADTLCSRPQVAEADDGSAWAVVIRAYPPSRNLAAWLRRALAVNGSVVVFATSGRGARRWRAFLTRSGVPFGSLNCLVPDQSGRVGWFRLVGAVGNHLVRLVSACSTAAASVPIEIDENGDCAISVWPASAPDASAELRTWKCPALGPSLQVADACRLWNGSLPCERPQVLHVDFAGRIRACWYGPAVGAVGDAVSDISSRNRAVAIGAAPVDAARPCPLGLPRAIDKETYDRLWDLDLASQLSWLVPQRTPGDFEQSGN